MRNCRPPAMTPLANCVSPSLQHARVFFPFALGTRCRKRLGIWYARNPRQSGTTDIPPVFGETFPFESTGMSAVSAGEMRTPNVLAVGPTANWTTLGYTSRN